MQRVMITSLTGAENPHVPCVHSGFNVPHASYSCRSRQFFVEPITSEEIMKQNQKKFNNCLKQNITNNASL